jgi:extradiol dioxygenase family protein
MNSNLDIGLTHIALPVADVDRSTEFYAQYAGMQVVHRRVDAATGVAVVWLCDRTRPFVIVLIQTAPVQTVLSPLAHLGTVSTVPNKATTIQVSAGNVEITAQTSANQDADLEAHLPADLILNDWSQFKVESGALKGCVARHLSTFSSADKKVKERGLPISVRIDGRQIHTSSSYAETAWSEVVEQENTTTQNGEIDILLNLQILQKAGSIMPPGSVILEISPDANTGTLPP